MYIPDGILYSKTGEWALKEDDFVLIGISDFAIEQLGDIISVELPDIGAVFSKDETFAAIESPKEIKELYMPIGGKITEINEQLINSPEFINEDSYKNYLIKIEPSNFIEDSQNLLDYSDYKEEF